MACENTTFKFSGLNDLYVRFFRLAEQRIAEVGGRGIVCFISNLLMAGRPFAPRHAQAISRRLRPNMDRQLQRRQISDGQAHTRWQVPTNRCSRRMTQAIGIQVGTAIATMVKTGCQHDGELADVRYRDLWGLSNDKRMELVRSLSEPDIDSQFSVVVPSRNLRFILARYRESNDYSLWPRLVDVFVDGHPGIQTSRDELLVDIDRDVLAARMKRYFSPGISDEQFAEECPSAMRRGNRFAARVAPCATDQARNA